MAKKRNQKLRILYVRDILSEHIGRERPITTDGLLCRLAEKGIVAERRSVCDDLRALETYGLCIRTVRCGRRNGYYLAP